MTTAAPIRIADEVVKAINAHDFAFGDFTAVRSSGSWDEDFKGLTDMSVDVVYRKNGNAINLLTVTTMSHDAWIVIAVRKRFSPLERDTQTSEVATSAVDPLDTLVTDIAKFFITNRNSLFADVPEITFETDEIKPMLGNESKLRKGLYYGLVQIPFSLRENI